VTPTLVFDIETIPDAQALRSLRPDLAALADDALVDRVLEDRKAATGSTFLQHHLHQVVAISCVFRSAEGLKVRSLGESDSGEARVISDFFKTIDKHTPQLVSWNGSGFDAQVLHYRCLKLGITASRYWDWGDDDRDFKWNNYLNRYHTRHLDLMDVLAGFTPRANAPLDDIAKICGLPGKLGMDGSQVLNAHRAGKLADIRAYCETDVMNTWLVYCRFQLMRGVFTPAQLAAEEELARSTMREAGGTHWEQYLAAWPA
jgi:predicted PolB exonuclease-like 3'-5' exonuclease